MASPNLDLLLIETYSTKTLGIADISIYPSGFTISNPSMEITVPGYNKVNVTFTPRNANVYRSEDLGVFCDDECVDLPDGIYTVKYSVNPNVTNYVEKSFIRVENIKCRYMSAFLTLDLNKDCAVPMTDNNRRELENIRLLIEGSVAAANTCDEVNSRALYRKADDRLSKLLNNCNCVNK